MIKNYIKLILFIVLGWFIQNSGYSCATQKVTVFTYRAPESTSDHRYEYDYNLLRLALENTVETDGPYQLVPSPVMNFKRAHSYIESNSLPNFILKLSYDQVLEEKGMGFAPFPVDRGIVGYRVCFAHPNITKELLQIDSLVDLFKFTHGQGTGWTDTAILRHNGFNVTEVATYESLFKMAANRRFDLFCRGANELLDEVKTHQHIKNLSYDKSMVIYYPFPRFFYTNSDNSDALDRIQRGLIKSYKNGSLQKLWHEHYEESIDFVELDKRRMFILANPFIKHLNVEYQQYFYKPLLKN